MKRPSRLTALLLAVAMLAMAACSRPAETQGPDGGTSTSQDGSGQGGTGGTDPSGGPRRGPNGEVYGGTYRMAIGAEPAVMDPQLDTTLQVYRLARNLFNTLVRYRGTTLELEPELLAEMPTVSADGRTYSFRLREGVKFHNGVELTTKDVKYTIERMLNPATMAKNTWVFHDIVGADEMLEGKATELAGLKDHRPLHL
ncbi:MAG: hypothetical protein A6D92_00810 [Symbiobacterium thermophilum]|uniref:Solute-binding protein family 5 domain-containing protein n=1 Tax=Symbiobacterium thermophilum TaxID=2734 RepID=A0A1Y2T6Y0_SYMTR|nr:MAG: hypothetical protein A6D92_00810 [Symbiobacterium thermophilum]